jgi:hypothetical protein
MRNSRIASGILRLDAALLLHQRRIAARCPLFALRFFITTIPSSRRASGNRKSTSSPHTIPRAFPTCQHFPHMPAGERKLTYEEMGRATWRRWQALPRQRSGSCWRTSAAGKCRARSSARRRLPARRHRPLRLHPCTAEPGGREDGPGCDAHGALGAACGSGPGHRPVEN